MVAEPVQPERAPLPEQNAQHAEATRPRADRSLLLVGKADRNELFEPVTVLPRDAERRIARSGQRSGRIRDMLQRLDAGAQCQDVERDLVRGLQDQTAQITRIFRGDIVGGRRLHLRYCATPSDACQRFRDGIALWRATIRRSEEGVGAAARLEWQH